MKDDAYYRKLDQMWVQGTYPRMPKFPRQPKESIEAGEGYYEWLAREFGQKEEEPE